MCATGAMSLPLTLLLLWLAAVLGNQSNYAIGRRIGPRVFQWESSRWFNRRAFDQAHAFYERYGGVTVIAARFMPFLRTFAPFVAGVAQMTRSRFTLFDITGGALWIGSVTVAGYLFGNIPWVKDNLDKIIWAAILVPGAIVLIGAWRATDEAGCSAGLGLRGAAPGLGAAALAELDGLLAAPADAAAFGGSASAGQACCW